MFNFSSEIIFGQHLETFYWSHCQLGPIIEKWQKLCLSEQPFHGQDKDLQCSKGRLRKNVLVNYGNLAVYYEVITIYVQSQTDVLCSKNRRCIFKKFVYSWPLFLYVCLFNTVGSRQMFLKSLPMTRFEPRISGVGGDRSTTEPQPLSIYGQNFDVNPGSVKFYGKGLSM